jgi:hypothetical protein
MSRYISELPTGDQGHLVELAQGFYSPQARALVGLVFVSLGLSVPRNLALSLNPTTVYKLKLDQSSWTNQVGQKPKSGIFVNKIA